MSKTPTFYLFPLLSLLAAFCLWGVFISNGALDTMDQNITKGILADTSPLRTTYTGIRPIDAFLANMVSFTFPVASDKFPLGRLFLMNFLGELTPIMVLFIVESYVIENQRTSTQFSTIWLLAYQVVAGALVVPMYFFCQLRLPSLRTRSRTLPASSARVLLPSIVIGYVFPAFLGFYSSRWSVSKNQLCIGIFQLFPVLIPATRLVLSAVFDTINSPKPAVASRRQMTHLKVLYLGATLVSSLTHLYTTAGIFSQTDLSLWEFYVPNLLAPSFDGKVLAFLQFDYIIIMFSTLLWIWLDSSVIQSGISLTLALLLGLVFGPGTVIGLLLTYREAGLDKNSDFKLDGERNSISGSHGGTGFKSLEKLSKRIAQ